VIGFNQPQARPSDRNLLGHSKNNQEVSAVADRQKTEKALSALLPKANERQLRLILLITREIVKRE
jgi:hypothetical protein